MKKPLLLACLSGLLTLNAYAVDEPQYLENVGFQSISPNGRYLVSNVYGIIDIYDTVENKSYHYEADTDDWDTSYFLGNGELASNSGIIAATNRSVGKAVYWQNGEWYELEVLDEETYNFINAVTPDGSRICGYVTNPGKASGDDDIIGLPAYWDAEADGGYGKCNILPYPKVDFLGRIPSSITAISMSSDGKTIVGQLHDYSDMVVQPIIYTQDEKGEWSYELLYTDNFVTDGLEPEKPGEAPVYPEFADYMTEDEMAEYNEAVNAYWSGESDSYPEATDYMSAEKKAEYDTAMEAYNVVASEWQEKDTAWYDWFYKLIDYKIYTFDFNDCRVTSDGSKYITTRNIKNPDDPYGYPETVAVVYDLKSGETTTYEKNGYIRITQAVDNNTFLAYDNWNYPYTGYVIENGEITKLSDYILGRVPELKDWMNEYFFHEYEETNYDTNESVQGSGFFTGMSVMSSDKNVLGFWVENAWDFYAEGLYTVGAIIDFSKYAGVSEVTIAEGGKIAFDANGNLSVSEEINSVEVYDLAGRLVLNNAGANNLGNGVYLVKATLNDGTVHTAKLAK